MISNTAIPKYYGKFREDVINGRIPVCEKISLEMNRIDALIDDPTIYYDDTAVEGWIKFCEEELTLTDGSDMNLLDSFKLWGEQVFGWYRFIRKSVYCPNKDSYGGHYEQRVVKRRLRNKQYILLARGGAKSIYGSTIHGYGLTVDVTTTNQVATAPTMKQAEETLGPLRTAIVKSRGPFFRFLTLGSLQNTTGSRENRLKLASTKKGIQNFLTNSLLEIRPMTIPKNQGYRDKYATIDEWLSCDIREDVIGAIEQGASKVDDYLIIATSSEGTIRNGVGDTIKMELNAILNGDYPAENVSIFWYCLDDIKEVANPNLWVKANPNLGITVDYEVYQRDVERMENAPGTRNDILAKRFGIPLEGFTYFFSYEQTKPHNPRSFRGMSCSMGSDLSRGDDFCAFTFLFPTLYEEFGIKARAYITERTLLALPGALREKYNEFINEGTLVVMPGSILNMIDVYDDLDQFIVENRYDVCCMGYDPYNAKDFVEKWERENGSYGVIKVIQGAKTESVPLGELRKLAESRSLLFDEALMVFSMGNAITLEDTNGNRKLYKQRKDQKIDNVSALLDAYVAYKMFRDQIF